ncbi:MAG TPA: L,D-transpeptidase family protein [Xanthobacteraceae bacterium]|nr:L,D-transpeptidase family protein [Xanthobacteraceae bacterium]
MQSRRFDQILTGTAIALVLGLTFAAQTASAQSAANAAIEAKVPMPEPANLPPPSAADVAAPSTETTGSTAAPAATLPEPPALPPAASQDVASPAPAAAPAAPTEMPSATATAPGAAPVPAATTSAPEPAATVATPEPAKPTEPTKVAAPADQPIRDALRELISGAKLTHMIERKGDRTAVEAFYASRDYEPLFAGNEGPTAVASQAINHLRNADADGMDPADYPVPSFQSGGTPAALAEAEMRLVSSVLDYARQAQTGRVHYSRVSADIYYEQVAPQPLDILHKIATARDAEAALDSYQPPHAAYKALRKKLAEARGKSDAPAAQIAQGPVLELSVDRHTKQAVLMSDERVPALRAKLGLDPVKDDTFYDKPLADAVAAFQKEHGLSGTGRLTPQTVDAINGKRLERVDQLIIANMERWRWLPRDLGHAHVILNIPDYTLRVYNNGAQVWMTRVVVGKPGVHATPLLSETMKYITVNPTWNVPPSIVYNEYLPALQQDPTVLKRMGLNLVQNRDGSVHISQPPGEANALGRIRFNFPNKFLVYQHDTPDKYLFAHPKRAYSHGCMRVQDPAKYAEVMTGLGMPGHGYTQEQIKGMFGSAEIDLKFTNPVPVHITYQTAFVDENGNLQTREDVYGRDATLLALLKGDHKQAEIPVAHAQPGYGGHPNVKLPPGYGNDYSGGPSFLDRLFGSPAQPAPQGRQRRAQRTVTTQYAPPSTARRD